MQRRRSRDEESERGGEDGKGMLRVRRLRPALNFTLG